MSFEGLLLGRTLLERYRIDGLVGGGAMGVVYRATDLRLDRVVAAKVLSERALDPAARERSRARFRREAVTAARLTHEHVVRTYDFGTDAALDLDVLVMELLEGADLDAWVERHGPAPPALARELMAQAGRGLGAGHRLGLVHRDVKPSNLLVSERGGRPWLFVLDFGIVEMADAAGTLTKLTAAGFIPGTLRYASPEQLRGLGALSPASDVFSLGATAFELLTGEHAFVSAEAAERLSAPAALAGLLAERGVPHDLVAVVARAVDPVAERRFGDGDAFADALLGMDAGGTATAAAPADARRWWVEPGAAERTEPTRAFTDPARGASVLPAVEEPAPPAWSASSWLLAALVVAILVLVFVFVVPRDSAAGTPSPVTTGAVP